MEKRKLAMKINAGIEFINGDCLVEMKNIESGSVDLILTDLPFGLTRQAWDKHLNATVLWSHYTRVIKPSGVVALFAKPPFDKQLACSNMPMYRYDWIWEKTRATGHLNANKMPLQAYENVCIFYKKLPTYNPQKTTGHKPVNSFYTRNSGECYGDSKGVSYGGGSTERYPRNVIKFAPVPNTNRLHPNQKPIDLLEYFIRTYTNENDLVLDSCAGVASTLVACININRRCIGIEKSKDIYKTGLTRITL